MRYDYEGHAIATTIADAASTLTAHEQAAYFGYDCNCNSCCQEMEFEICEECELQIDIDYAHLANYQHAIYCSFYPDSIED